MALTVSAVVHFSQGDVSMAQLRVQESRAWWAGRGAALLAMRDRQALGRGGDGNIEASSGTSAEEDAASDVTFTRRYRFDDFSVVVTLYPASGFVSLNSAGFGELNALFRRVGLLDVDSAAYAAEALITKRSMTSVDSFETLQNPGIRFVEELLAVPGMTRSAYDRIRQWVHPFWTGRVDINAAPAGLARLLSDEFASNGESDSRLRNEEPGFGERAAGTPSGAEAPVVAILDFTFSETEHYRQMIFMGGQGADLLRVGGVSRLSPDDRSSDQNP